MAQAEWEAWKTKRASEVTSTTGWLSVCGLFWLKENDVHHVGSATTNDVILPAKTPAQLGTLRTTGDGESVYFKSSVPTKENEEVLLVHDMKVAKPTTVYVGDVLFFVIKRSTGLGVRVKDTKSEKIAGFRGLEYFSYDEKARIIAKLVPNEKTIKVPNVLDAILEYKCPGTLEFTWTDGKKYSLDPVLESDTATKYFIIFKDATSNVDTFVYTSLPNEKGEVALDFNQAFSPACMFTQFAACPLPPKQNVLPFRIEAGEMKYDGLH